MKCPIDGSELKITDRQGIELDYCPQCRGVWLDRGELDKIIDRTSTTMSSRDDDDDFRPQQQNRPPSDEYRSRDNDYRPEQTQTPHKKKKRGGFLEDLFDFG